MALITIKDITNLCRPCYADDEIAAALIAEAEREDILPRVGAEVYALLQAGADCCSELLNGGLWYDACGRARYLAGLKTALAYLAYARIVRDGNILPTRYGSRLKNDENSAEAITAERQRQYRQTFASGDMYLRECLAYINANCEALGVSRVGGLKSNRTRFRVIDSGRVAMDSRCNVPAPAAAPALSFNNDFNNDFNK